jgi:hypothetical protein
MTDKIKTKPPIISRLIAKDALAIKVKTISPKILDQVHRIDTSGEINEVLRAGHAIGRLPSLGTILFLTDAGNLVKIDPALAVHETLTVEQRSHYGRVQEKTKALWNSLEDIYTA